MTALLQAGFETGDFSEFTSVTDPNSKLSVTADAAMQGNFGMEINLNGGVTAVAEKVFDAGQDEVFASFLIRFPLLAVIPTNVVFRIVAEPLGGNTFQLFYQKQLGVSRYFFIVGGAVSGSGVYVDITSYTDDSEPQRVELFGRRAGIASPTAWLDWNGVRQETITPVLTSQFTGMQIGDTTTANWGEVIDVDSVEAHDEVVEPGALFAPGVVLGRTSSEIAADNVTAQSIRDQQITAQSIADEQLTAASVDFPTAG
ncbi:MAG: hypothetical protein OES13_00475 [Acidimicrobiia bacterium]|nr:hypothetical protein [Acidimicrobiia bacterium]